MDFLLYVLGGYFIFINVFTFMVWGVDKRKAENKKRRVSERRLYILTWMGGFIGGLMGMGAFHHKTIKGKFLRRFMLIALAWVVIILLITYFWRI